MNNYIEEFYQLIAPLNRMKFNGKCMVYEPVSWKY